MKTSEEINAGAKKAEDSKQEIVSERKLLRTIIDNIPVCVYTKDTNFRKTLVNKHELNQFGWNKEEDVLGKTDKELFGEEVGTNTQREDEQVLLEGKTIIDEEKHIGNGMWAMISKLPLRNDNDEIVGLLGISVNVTDRVKHEKKLMESYERLNEMSAQSNSFAWEIDLTGLYTFMSPIVEKVLGYKADELKNKKYFYDLLAPSTKEVVMKDAFEIISQNRTINNYERKAVKANGSEVWLSTNCKPLYDNDGNVKGYRGSDTDITQQRNLLESLELAKKNAEKSAKAKESFLTNMSHEIRTPLNVIIGMIREIGKEQLSESQKTYLKHSEASAYHLLSIINNVLDMSKIEAGEFTLDIKDFSLSAVLSNVKSILTSRASGKKIMFTVESSALIARALKGDSLRLSQVLINLLGNSIKFTDEGFVKLNVILLESDDEIQKIRFEIIDSGIGMSHEFQQNIFNKFTQENDHSTRSHEGTGLGMSISKEIIELMGGNVELESIKGKGTKIAFEINFPYGIEDNLIRIDNVTRNFDISGTKVLVVEDNEMNRFIARQSLKQAKCVIHEADNGAIAVELLQKEKSDIILMDIQMPVMDGMEATKIIRNNLKISTPIVALTANAFKHDIDLYMSNGMNDYLIKPYKEEELYSKIEKYCRIGNKIKKEFSSKPENDKYTSLPTNIETESLYNLKQLNVIANGDKKFVETMINMFINIAKTTISQLNEAFQNNDIEQIKKLSHKIKPSLDNLEINILYNEIRALESFNEKTGCPENLRTMVEFVTETLVKVIDDLLLSKTEKA
jgi:PAS domain S-box-containing protein